MSLLPFNKFLFISNSDFYHQDLKQSCSKSDEVDTELNIKIYEQLINKFRFYEKFVILELELVNGWTERIIDKEIRILTSKPFRTIDFSYLNPKQYKKTIKFNGSRYIEKKFDVVYQRYMNLVNQYSKLFLFIKDNDNFSNEQFYNELNSVPEFDLGSVPIVVNRPIGIVNRNATSATYDELSFNVTDAQINWEQIQGTETQNTIRGRTQHIAIFDDDFMHELQERIQTDHRILRPSYELGGPQITRIDADPNQVVTLTPPRPEDIVYGPRFIIPLSMCMTNNFGLNIIQS